VAGPRAVVAVVGSAHVGGIVREWSQAADLDRLSQLLAQKSETWVTADEAIRSKEWATSPTGMKMTLGMWVE